MNKDNLPCTKLGNTGIYAESIAYVNFFTYNYYEIESNGLKVKVASPASFVLQKLRINGRREDKREKDIQAIKEMLPFIKSSKKCHGEMTDLFDSLPKKWKKVILLVCENESIDLFR